MKEHLVTYFLAERRDGLLALIAGVVALAAAGWLASGRSAFRGAAIPLAAIAVIELGVGISYVSRNASLVATLLDQLQTAPVEMARGELARMAPVLRNYRITVLLEVLVLVGGAALALSARREFIFAIGVGCIIQAAPLLIADVLGTRRADVYMDTLRSFLAGA